MNISIAMGPWLPVPPIKGGAVPRLWQGLAEKFAARGHAVTILCRSYVGQPHCETVNGVKYIRCSGFSQGRHIGIDLLKDLAYAVRVTPLLPLADIIVINDFWLPVFVHLARSNAGQIVVNVNRFPKGQLFLYSGAARLAAASNVVRAAIADQCPSLASRVRVFPNPIDTDMFFPPMLPRLNRDDKTMLYVGRIHPEKGLHLLVDAFALLAKNISRVRLKVVGPVREDQGGGGLSYFRSLQSKAVGLNVQFLDPVFEAGRLADVYRNADVFCYPSLAEKGESFGVAPLEAMATGLTPVVSSLECFRDFIEHEKTGYYFNHRGPEAVNNLARVLREALMNWEQTLRMGVEASRVAQRFSYGRVASLYLEDFEYLFRKRTLKTYPTESTRKSYL